VNHRKNREVE